MSDFLQQILTSVVKQEPRYNYETAIFLDLSSGIIKDNC